MQNFNRQELSANVGSPKFSPKKEMALIALLEGTKFSEAATKIGVSERSVLRWLKEPEFQERLNQGMASLRTQALDLLRDTLCKATKRLSELVDSSSEKIALQASELVINFNLKLKEEQELAARIQELEKVLSEREDKWREP